MWLLWWIFNDIVDIAVAPVKVATKITDFWLTGWQDEPLTNMIDNLKESIKIDEK
jgi:hypothetical protein